MSPDAKVKGKGAAVLTGIGTVKESIKRYTFPGIKNPKTLLEIAETIYTNLGRSESKIRFSTIDLKDLGGDDLLLLRPGDPVQIGFDEVNVEYLRSLPAAERENRLIQLGYSRTVANLVATEFDKIKQFQVPFYTKDVTFNWSNSDGLSINVEAMNFISVGRDDNQ